MAFLSAVLGVVGEDGERVDSPAADGSYRPVMLKLGTNLSATAEVVGGVSQVTMNSASSEGGGGGAELEALAQGISTLIDADLVAIDNVTPLSGTGATIDGVTVGAEDIVVLAGQEDPRQNGPWLASADAWTRPVGFTASAPGVICRVFGGDLFRGTHWYVRTLTGRGVIGTDQLSVTQIDPSYATIKGVCATASSSLDLNGQRLVAGGLELLANGPTITTGTAVPTASETAGSVYLRSGTSPGVFLRKHYAWSDIQCMGTPINVIDAGADPTGVADSTTAIQAAINAGKNVYFPKGTYLITSTITVSVNGTGLVFERGAVIKRSDAFIAVLVSGSYCFVMGAEIDCNSKGTASHFGLFVTGAWNTIRDCYVHHTTGTDGHGICIDGQGSNCYHNLVTGCQVGNVTGIGISQNHTSDNRIVDCDIHDCGLEGLTIDNQSSRAVVKGCQIEGVCTANGVGGIGIDFSDSSTISGCRVSSCAKPGITFQNNLGASNCNVISGCVIDAVTTYGIDLKTTSGNGTFYSCITGNLVRGNSLTKSIHIAANSNYNLCAPNQLCGVAAENVAPGTGNVI